MHLAGKAELAILIHIYWHNILRTKLALQNHLGDGIFNMLLNSSLEWPCSKDGVKTNLGNFAQRSITNLQLHIDPCQTIGQVFQQDLRNIGDIVFI